MGGGRGAVPSPSATLDSYVSVQACVGSIDGCESALEQTRLDGAQSTAF